jgi:hypothetical protein
MMHQAHGLACNRESEMGESCRKASNPQNANRVFSERIGYMSQNTILDIGRTTPRVDKLSVSIPGNGVDCQVAALQVFFDGDIG